VTRVVVRELDIRAQLRLELHVSHIILGDKKGRREIEQAVRRKDL
jgi:hypothetical protein